MSAADYFEGAAIFVPMLAAALGGAWLLLRRRFPALAGAEAVTAYGVLATVGLLAIHLLPAILGILGRGSVLAAAAMWLVACALIPATSGPPQAAAVDEPVEDGRAPSLLALLAAGLVGVFFLAFARDQLTIPASSVDFATFHMPDVARWIQSGSIWDIASFVPLVAPGNYPNNGDVLFLAFVLPWHNDFLAHFAIWPFYPLAGVATYALARRLRAPRPAAVIAGALLLAIPAVGVSTLRTGLVDATMYFGFAAGLVFLLRHHETGRTGDLVMAGLALGIAFGTKWYGVSAVAVVFIVWLAARRVWGVEWRRLLPQAGALAGTIGAAGGIWLVRNWVESGNPVFPVKVAPLGVTIFDAPADVVRERAGFTVVDYIYDADVWSELIWPQYEQALAAPAAVAVVGLLAAALVLAYRWARAGVDRGVAAWSVVCAGLLLAAYAITPYTAGGPEGQPLLVAADSRYAVPALIVALAAAAWLSSRVRWGTVAFCAVGAAAVVHGISWSARGSLSRASLTALDWAAGVAIALAIAAVAGLCLWWIRRTPPGRLRTLGFATAGALLAAGALAAGQPIQERFNDDRYRGADPVLDVIVEQAPPGSRIGLAGAWTDLGLSPILPSFGERFENEVEYVGPLVDELQQRYESRQAFVAALERGDYDYVLVGRGRPELPPPQEGAWARSAGWGRVAMSDRLELYAPPR